MPASETLWGGRSSGSPGRSRLPHTDQPREQSFPVLSSAILGCDPEGVLKSPPKLLGLGASALLSLLGSAGLPCLQGHTGGSEAPFLTGS